MRSLRLRITAVATAAAAAGLIATGWLVPNAVGHLLTEQAADEAAVAATELLRDTTVFRGDLPLDGSGRLLQLRSDGRIIASSNGGVRVAGGNIEISTNPVGDGWITGESDLQSLDDQWLVATVIDQRDDSTLSATAAVPVAEVRTAVRDLRILAYNSVPLLVLAIAVLVWFAVGAMLRPIERVRAEASTLAMQPLPSPLTTPTAGTEIIRMVETFNQILARARAATIRQHRLVADASHELLNPLAAIRSQLEVALHRSDPDWPAVARRCLRTEARLSETAQNLLLLARSGIGDPRTRGPVELDTLARDEAAEHEDVTVEAAKAVVHGHYGDIARLVHNLLANAARYRRTTTILRVHQDSDFACLQVDDDGPGIPPDQRLTVLEPFTKLQQGRHPYDAGTGLGLAIVAQVAQDHLGDVQILDSPLGGTRVQIRFPINMTRHANGEASRNEDPCT